MGLNGNGYTKGEEPIAKNIRVIDEQGQTIGETYPKRAKGLIKHGRARFMDEHTIMHFKTRPPNNEYLEDYHMDYINGNGPAPRSETKPEAMAETAVAPEEAGKPILTMEWLLDRIDTVINDKEYFKEALAILANLKPDRHGSNDSIITGVNNMIRAREETNRQIISLLHTMYTQLNPNAGGQGFPPIPPLNPIPLPPHMPSPHFPAATFSQMINVIRGIDWDDIPDEIHDVINEALKNKKIHPDVLKKMLDEIKSVDWDDVPDAVRESVIESFRSMMEQ